MTATQKIIKYAAIAFALFLIVAIISGIVNVVYSIGSAIFGESPKMDEYVYLVEKEVEARELNIETSATNIKIVQGEKFNIKTNNQNITYNQKDERIIIKDKKKNYFNIKSVETELIIEIPTSHQFTKIEIEAGAGKTNIENLEVATLGIEQGAGALYLKNVITSNESEIEGGAGQIRIEESAMHNLDLEIGTGSFKYSGTISGSSKIECGVGSTTINLNNQKEDYQLHLEKGIGSITVDDKKVSNNTTIGDGDNKISIEGGVGSISINFNE